MAKETEKRETTATTTETDPSTLLWTTRAPQSLKDICGNKSQVDVDAVTNAASSPTASPINNGAHSLEAVPGANLGLFVLIFVAFQSFVVTCNSLFLYIQNL